MATILVVYHTQSGNTRQAAESLAKGVEAVPNCRAIVKTATAATKEDLLNCDGLAVGSPDYFSYMAGAIKDFFDRTFYPTQGKVDGKPCVVFLTHGGGGRARQSLVDICDSFKFELVTEPVMIENSPDSEEKEELKQAGRTLAESCM